MSFWDGVKTVGGFLLEQAQKKQESILHYKERYDALDDRDLIRRYKAASGDAKIACAMLLKERGYGSETQE